MIFLLKCVLMWFMAKWVSDWLWDATGRMTMPKWMEGIMEWMCAKVLWVLDAIER